MNKVFIKEAQKNDDESQNKIHLVFDEWLTDSGRRTDLIEGAYLDIDEACRRSNEVGGRVESITVKQKG